MFDNIIGAKSILMKDSQLARERKITFEVAEKAARGAKWETISTTKNLRKALTQAHDVKNYQSCVFAKFPDGLGFIYWSSRNPENLNSSIISMQYTYSTEKPS